MVIRFVSDLFLGFLLFVCGLLLFGAAGVLFFGLFRQSYFNSVDENIRRKPMGLAMG